MTDPLPTASQVEGVLTFLEAWVWSVGMGDRALDIPNQPPLAEDEGWSDERLLFVASWLNDPENVEEIIDSMIECEMVEEDRDG